MLLLTPRLGSSTKVLLASLALLTVSNPGLCRTYDDGRAAAVLTAHNDNYRTGANLNETLLTSAHVAGEQFGKLFSLTVDGCVYAQPLVILQVPMPGGDKRNLVIVATEHNSVYAFDADDHSGANAKPIWQRSLIDPRHGFVPVRSRDFDVRLPFGM